ncbi:MAG TPA: hypothetical protein VF702_01465 [Allosphingosinicella sp.]|jgi:hypothetical protein
MQRCALPLLAVLALAACRDEPTVAEQFNSLKAEVENKGVQYEADANNLVAAEERRLAEELNAVLASDANLLDNGSPVAVDVNSGEVDLNAR